MINRETLKTIIDKPIDSNKFKAFDKMVSELGPYLHPIEVDKLVDFMYTMEQSEFDINPSIGDSLGQLKLILGEERYEKVVNEWKQNNQKLLSVFGTLKYKEKANGKMWDGLDPEDNPEHYEKVYI